MKLGSRGLRARVGGRCAFQKKRFPEPRVVGTVLALSLALSMTACGPDPIAEHKDILPWLVAPTLGEFWVNSRPVRVEQESATPERVLGRVAASDLPSEPLRKFVLGVFLPSTSQMSVALLPGSSSFDGDDSPFLHTLPSGTLELRELDGRQHSHFSVEAYGGLPPLTRDTFNLLLLTMPVGHYGDSWPELIHEGTLTLEIQVDR